MEAAFFDLDKTVIAKASMAAFACTFYQEGLLTRRTLVRSAWTQLLYLRVGASAKRLARIRRSVLALTAGWEQDHVRRVVAEALTNVVDPIVFAEAMELIAEHRQAGRRVYIVSAAPSEIVEPLARHLGVHEALASQAAVDSSGRYTGQLERHVYGPTKATLIRQIALRHGMDLSKCYAYTDSATDLPMLEAVGHPVAVNPDRPLRRIARVRGWEVRTFDRVRLAEAGVEVEVEVEVGVGTPASRPRRGAPVGALVATALVAAMTGGVTAAAWRVRARGRLASANAPTL